MTCPLTKGDVNLDSNHESCFLLYAKLTLIEKSGLVDLSLFCLLLNDFAMSKHFIFKIKIQFLTYDDVDEIYVHVIFRVEYIAHILNAIDAFLFLLFFFPCAYIEIVI